MLRVKARPFVEAAHLIAQLSIAAADTNVTSFHENTLRHVLKIIDSLIEQLNVLALDMTSLAAKRLRARMEDSAVKPSELQAIVNQVHDRLFDEMETTFLLSLSRPERNLFDPEKPLFGPKVEKAFPEMSEDISEAGKCLGLSRPTSAVFHLMRVMELAVRKLGDELGINLVEEKNWQPILNEVNRAIKGLDHKLARTKILASVAAHLYAVKVAWRNEVMHPKQAYTAEQALVIFDGVRVFVSDLADIL